MSQTQAIVKVTYFLFQLIFKDSKEVQGRQFYV